MYALFITTKLFIHHIYLFIHHLYILIHGNKLHEKCFEKKKEKKKFSFFTKKKIEKVFLFLPKKKIVIKKKF